MYSIDCDDIESDVSTAIENYRMYFDEDPERLFVNNEIYFNTFDEEENENGPLWMFTLKVEPLKTERKFYITDSDKNQKVFPDGSFEGYE